MGHTWWETGFGACLGITARWRQQLGNAGNVKTQLQLSCGGEDENGDLYVANATSQYGAYKDPFTNPPGSVWRVVSADKVPAGAKTAPVKP